RDLEEEVKGWLPPGSSVELTRVGNWDRSEASLDSEFSLKIRNIASSTGRRVLLPMAVFQTTKKRPFPHAKRVHPIYFSYPFQEIDDVALRLPDGYDVEKLPEARKVSPGVIEYEVTHSNEGGALRAHRRFAINNFFFKVDAYEDLRAFFDYVR